MPKTIKFSGYIAGLVLLTAAGMVRGDDWPWRRKASPELLNSPEQIARSIDAIQEKILDDGVIVVKRPDVWGQNRMSTYRDDFEKNMTEDLSNDTFRFTVAGRIFRSEQAALSSQLALGSSLTALSDGKATNAIALTNEQIVAERDARLTAAKALLPSQGPLQATAPGTFFQGGAPFQNIGMGEGQLGIEPTVYLDEKKRFLDHLNEIRRVNIGDDVSDMAGYGLYLFRIPVSIQPGECTLKGHGGVVTASVRPDFGPNFLRDTYRTLVVADVVDQLSPVIFEIIRSGVLDARRHLEQERDATRVRLADARATKERAIQETELSLVAYMQKVCGNVAPIISRRANAADEIARRIFDSDDPAAEMMALSTATKAVQRGGIVSFRDLRLPSSVSAIDLAMTREATDNRDEIAAAVGRMKADIIQDAAPGQAAPPAVPSQAERERTVETLERSVRGLESGRGIAPADAGDQYNQLRSAVRGYLEANLPAPPAPPEPALDGLGAISPPKAGMVAVDRPAPARGRRPKTDGVRRVSAAPLPTKGGDRFNILEQCGREVEFAAELMSGTDEEVIDRLMVVTADPKGGESTQAVQEGIRAIEGASKQLRDIEQSLSQLNANLDAIGATSLPSTRDNTRVYPIAPSDIDDVFLSDALYRIAEDVVQALPTERKKASDVRAYLQHQLEAAYDLLPYFEGLIPQITDDVDRREFLRGDGFSKLRDEDYSVLAASLPGDLRGRIDHPLVALCWAIAVDAGQLDKRLKDDMKATFGRGGLPAPEVDGLPFYASQPPLEAHDAFTRYVTARWPMAAFALDPVVDQQNIDEAMSQRRDLQLALAFSFAAGRTSFENLNRYSKRLEQDAETIALNKTVTAFSHGADSFGWRFYPRYQNPPIENSNLQTITNLVWRGGPGRDYGVKNSKLEAGQRELTAVVVMPSFLERVKFEVVGNFFPLRDPDHMKTHSARMVNQGRQVEDVRQALANAHACGRYRAGDLERLASRLDQVEAMLPLQTLTVSVPYESTAAGFQLFTPGSQSLVPELVGFEGADCIAPGGPRSGNDVITTSLLVHAKRVSLHESHLVAGGVILEKLDPAANPKQDATVEVVSRDVLRVKIPGYATPTKLKTWTKDGEEKMHDFVELYVSTPNGISNRLLIPYGDPAEKDRQEAEAASKEAEAEEQAPGYRLVDDELKVSFKAVTEDSASRKAEYASKTSPEKIRIRLNDASGVIPSRLAVTFSFAALDQTAASGVIVVQAVALPDDERGAGNYVIQGAQLDKLAEQSVLPREDDPAFFEAASGGGLKANLVSRSVAIKPVFDGGPDVFMVETKMSANQLKVAYERAK